MDQDEQSGVAELLCLQEMAIAFFIHLVKINLQYEHLEALRLSKPGFRKPVVVL